MDYNSAISYQNPMKSRDRKRKLSTATTDSEKVLIIKLTLSRPRPLSRNLKKGPGAETIFLTTKFFH